MTEIRRASPGALRAIASRLSRPTSGGPGGVRQGLGRHQSHAQPRVRTRPDADRESLDVPDRQAGSARVRRQPGNEVAPMAPARSRSIAVSTAPIAADRPIAPRSVDVSSARTIIV